MEPIIILLALFAVIIIIYFLMIKPKKGNNLANHVLGYYAHRGLHDESLGVAENSLASYKRALDHGFGIELDVRFSKDGTLVVFHDDDLVRACGVGKLVKDCTLEELKKLTLFKTKDTIPTFDEALDLIDGKVPLLVEIKSESAKNTKAICEVVAKRLDQYKGSYIIQSFNPIAVRWFFKNRKSVPRGILACDFTCDKAMYGWFQCSVLTNMLTNFLSKPNFISYDWFHSGKLSVSICRRFFKSVCACWTIRSEETLNRLKDAGRCNIFIFEGFIPKV